MLLKDFFLFFYMPPAHFFLIEIRGMKFVYSVIIARVAMLDQDNSLRASLSTWTQINHPKCNYSPVGYIITILIIKRMRGCES